VVGLVLVTTKGESVNRDEFEAKFKEDTQAAWDWARGHRTFSLVMAGLFIGMILGMILRGHL
jgi:hypothetical protein